MKLIVGSKKCPRCKIVKSTSEFRARSQSSDGLSDTCKVCQKIPKSQADVSEQTRVFNLRHRLGLDDESIEYVYVLMCDPCSYCDGRDIELDHIVPVSDLGEANWINLTASCRACNAFKKSRSLLISMAFSRGCFQEIPPGCSFFIVDQRGTKVCV